MRIFRFLVDHYTEPSYLTMLIITLALLFAPVFYLFFDSLWLLYHLLVLAFIFVSVIYTSIGKQSLFINSLLGLVTILSLEAALIGDNLIFTTISALISMVFLLRTLYSLLYYLLKEKSVTIETLYAAIVGFFLIGFLTAVTFALCYWISPESLSLSRSVKLEMYDFIYFGFITITSIGYGDIVPLTRPAEALAIILGTLGQLYLTIVLAIILAQYIKTHHS